MSTVEIEHAMRILARAPESSEPGSYLAGRLVAESRVETLYTGRAEFDSGIRRKIVDMVVLERSHRPSVYDFVSSDVIRFDEPLGNGTRLRFSLMPIASRRDCPVDGLITVSLRGEVVGKPEIVALGAGGGGYSATSVGHGGDGVVIGGGGGGYSASEFASYGGNGGSGQFIDVTSFGDDHEHVAGGLENPIVYDYERATQSPRARSKPARKPKTDPLPNIRRAVSVGRPIPEDDE